MLVFRVDYSTSNGTPRTSVNLGDYPNNTAGKPGFSLIPADSLLMNYYRVYSSSNPQSEDRPYSEREYQLSHAGDPYPGSSNVIRIDSMQLNRTVINKPLYNIAENDGTITFDFLKDYILAGIDGITTLRRADDSVYDLQGRKIAETINQLPKGIYIHQGKKFVVK
jgi:immune inhibitor A